MQNSEMIAYSCTPDRIPELRHELGETILEEFSHVFLCKESKLNPVWARNIWRIPEKISFTGLGDASKKLRERNKLWHPSPHILHRRQALLQEKLPYFRPKPMAFLAPLPQQSLGSYLLTANDQMLASAQCSSPFPDGEIQFIEDKSAPSRAYLKLWDAFTVHTKAPARGATCVDLGSSPGGWTWVLQSLGCKVWSVDKAPLDPAIIAAPDTEVLKKDAFKIQPADLPPLDWLFSDIICYPERLYELVNLWLDSGRVKNFVCTIKFQGATDFSAIEKFRAIPGSKVVHLAHNKHELTWIKTENE